MANIYTSSKVYKRTRSESFVFVVEKKKKAVLLCVGEFWFWYKLVFHRMFELKSQ